MRSELGGKVGVISCDIRDSAAVDAMMEEIWREAPIDVLVNNAAADLHRADRTSVAAGGGCDPGADAARHDVLHARRGQALDRRQARGVVLSILSTSTITGRAFTVPSAMAKSAVLAMTRSLAVEWGPKGVRTVAIAPGAFPTPGLRASSAPKDAMKAGRNAIRSAAPVSMANLPIWRAF
jgi:NAD(P)-dependent dehydrogenase (short-subunit alcohol dehydrogenase family)